MNEDKNDINIYDKENAILKYLDFFDTCSSIVQDFRGHSSALRYICKKTIKNTLLKYIKMIE